MSTTLIIRLFTPITVKKSLLTYLQSELILSDTAKTRVQDELYEITFHKSPSVFHEWVDVDIGVVGMLFCCWYIPVNKQFSFSKHDSHINKR